MLFSQKITLFLLLCPLLAVASIGYAIYYSKTETTGLGTGFMIVVLLITVVLFALDRLAVRYVPAGWLSLVEGILLISASGWYTYSTRTSTLDLTANRSPYIVLIWAKNPAYATPFQRSSLFNKTLTVSDAQIIRLNRTEFEQLTLQPPTNWGNGYFSTGIDLNDPRFASAYFYAPTPESFPKAEITRLLHEAVAQQPQETDTYKK